MTNTVQTAMANGNTPHFNVGDKVRHDRDVSKGWDDYGIGTVTEILWDVGGFFYYQVHFPTTWGQRIPSYNHWDLVKV